MNEFLHTSTSPHVRSSLSTRRVMLDVIIALMPAAIFGVWHFGEHALLVLLASTAAAVLSELLFNVVTKRKQTVGDYSAVLTGLLLGLCLPPSVPLYIPVLGSVFAIVVAKCCFGGLGQNFMNPALAGRCFLLISFGVLMTNYDYKIGADVISGATPLAVLKDTGKFNDILAMALGFTKGTIACSAAALLIGGIYLIITGTITWHIPVTYIASFIVMMGLFGGKGFDPAFLAAHVCGGGLMIAAFFMATDPVTNPITPVGQMIFGIILGVLTSLFRINGSSAESVSYAVIISNLLVPMIDRMPVGQPFGIGTGAGKKEFPKAAIVLCVIALIAGAVLGVVNYMTAPKIAEQAELTKQESFKEVVPEAESFAQDDGIQTELEGEIVGNYEDGAFGRVTINSVFVGLNEAGEPEGYAISVSTNDGFDGNITMTVGISADGVVNGISFTEINETAGMGMRVTEDSWKEQFADTSVDKYVLNKAGGSTTPEEIDSVSGASISSGAVVNAVNAAIDFYADHIAQ